MKNKNIVLALLFIVLAALACNMPGGAPTEEPTYTDTPSPAPVFTETPTATVAACSPTVTTNTVANVRSGPGQMYAIIGSIPLGGTAPVAGKNFDGTWWYIEFAGGEGGHAWIAGIVTKADCIPSTLASIAAPPTPILPTEVPTNVPVADQPSSIPTLGILIINPGIFIIKTATPTLVPLIINPPIIINPFP